MDKIIIGTRGSVLALWQANFIKSELQNRFNIDSELKIIKTTGDKILDAPLAKIGGKGLFTKELEEMLLNGSITIAVHSLKDVPVVLHDDLILAAITKREDVRDCFISYKFSDISDLPLNAKLGTTSLRRSMQLKHIRNDLDTISLRGNVQTRLQRLKNNDFDAIILAKAGLNRLNLDSKDIKFIKPLDTSFMIPAMGQGALGIECKRDCKILNYLQELNDEISSIECGFEREFIRLLNGGCQVPIGVYAQYKDSMVDIETIIGLPDGSDIIREKISGSKDSTLANELLKKVEAKGARDVLKRALESINF